MAYTTRSGRKIKKVNYSDTRRRPRSRSVSVSAMSVGESDKENVSEEDSTVEMTDQDDVKQPPQKKQKVSSNASISTANTPLSSRRRRRRRRKPIEKVDTVVVLSDEDEDDEMELTASNTNTTTNTNTNHKHSHHTNCNHNHNHRIVNSLPSLSANYPAIPPMFATPPIVPSLESKSNHNTSSIVSQSSASSSSTSMVVPPLPSIAEIEAMETDEPEPIQIDSLNQSFSSPSMSLSSSPRLSLRERLRAKRNASLSLRRHSQKEEASDDESSGTDLEILTPNTKKKKQAETKRVRKKRVLPILSPQKPKVTKKRRVSSPKSPKKKEKRRARKLRGSQKTRDRLARARTQRIYMVDAKVINEHEREYKVLGSVGNLYTITIGTLHSCNCPDFRKGNLCKHILFVMLKVLRVSSSSELIFQKALLTSELEEIFEAAPQTLFGSVLANAAVRRSYKASTSTSDTGEDSDGFDEAKVERKPLEGDCPVCMEELEEGGEATTWCRAQCGNNVHTDCFKNWRKSAERNGQEVVCMFCRVEWMDGPEDGVKGGRKRKRASSGGSIGSEGYLNFAEEQGMSQVRDTSTYYSGPRRGYKYYGGWRGSWY